MMQIEVAYAREDKQVIIAVDVPVTASVKDALVQSQITEQFVEIDIDQAVVGIFSKKTSLDTKLQPGDRIEIYRPLTIDPKQARLLRAAKKAGK